MSRFVRFEGGSIPTSEAADEILVRPRRPHDCGIGVRNVLSLFHRTRRRKLMPHTRAPSLNRIDLNGICISMVHPPSNSPVRAFQRPFQLGLGCSFTSCESASPPRELA